MLREMLLGTTTGTLALNAVTYAEVPERVDIDLSGASSDEETAQSRKSGLGALLGYATGRSAYGMVRPRSGSVSRPLAGSDVPAIRLEVTEWSWASDIVPRLASGLITAIAHDASAAV